MSDPLLLLDAILELQELRACGRQFRDQGSGLLSRAAYRSARLLCAELRAGVFERPIPRTRYRTLA